MNKIFCSQCGQKHEYTDSKPKFCSECGSPLGAISASGQKRTKYEDEDEDEDDEDINFDTSKILLRVESHQEKGVKLGDIFKEASPPGEKVKRGTSITPEELTKRSINGYRFSID